jgi:GMP reductase
MLISVGHLKLQNIDIKMRIEPDIKLDYKDVLIRPKRSTLKSRKEVDLNRTYTFRNSKNKWHGIPLMAANMDGVGTFKMADALSNYSMLTCITKQTTMTDWENPIEIIPNDHISISVGTNFDAWKKARATIIKHKLRWVCIDIANGYSEHFTDFVKTARKDFPDINIIAGNVVTADMTQELLLAGADIVKVGIGPGSVCTTRIQTGIGYPQLSAVIECADAAHGLGGHVIADGGCTCPGDVAKAFAAGADFVMLGGMLAGHAEGGGEITTKIFKTGEYHTSEYGDRLGPVFDEKHYITFYGMSSDTAMNKHAGGVASYRSSEGRTVKVLYKGLVDNTVKDILGGLRSTCSYVGAPTLKQLSKCTTFVRCTQQFNNVFIK